MCDCDTAGGRSGLGIEEDEAAHGVGACGAERGVGVGAHAALVGRTIHPLE